MVAIPTRLGSPQSHLDRHPKCVCVGGAMRLQAMLSSCLRRNTDSGSPPTPSPLGVVLAGVHVAREDRLVVGEASKLSTACGNPCRGWQAARTGKEKEPWLLLPALCHRSIFHLCPLEPTPIVSGRVQLHPKQSLAWWTLALVAFE